MVKEYGMMKLTLEGDNMTVVHNILRTKAQHSRAVQNKTGQGRAGQRTTKQNKARRFSVGVVVILFSSG
jgi:hypothetical protein